MVTGRDVGLTVRDMSDMGRLAQLATNPQGTTREEIFLAVASLYRVQGAYLSERERSLMQDILERLARDVATAIRVGFAERLAGDSSAPRDLRRYASHSGVAPQAAALPAGVDPDPGFAGIRHPGHHRTGVSRSRRNP